MSHLPEVRIESGPDVAGQRHQAVYVDGVRLRGVSSVYLRMDAGSFAELTLTLPVLTVESKTAPTIVRLPLATQGTLLALGWTPPPGDAP